MSETPIETVEVVETVVDTEDVKPSEVEEKPKTTTGEEELGEEVEMEEEGEFYEEEGNIFEEEGFEEDGEFEEENMEELLEGLEEMEKLEAEDAPEGEPDCKKQKLCE